VEPAIRLTDGVTMGRAHADCLEMLAPVMTLDAGSEIYAPGGRLLGGEDSLRQPGLARALELLADEGPASAYTGTLARELLRLVDERGGSITPDDLARYEPRWSAPVGVPYAGRRALTRAGLSGVPATLRRLPELADATPAERVVRLVETFAAHEHAAHSHTTNLVAVDREGNVCVLTTSLGLGSGDFLPGLDLHLNSMLGEVDLLVGDVTPGDRMQSMMAPTVALDSSGPSLAIGSAGGTRLRTALVSVTAAVLDEGVEPQTAVDRGRVHPTGGTLNAEPGVDEDGLEELERRGWHVRRWSARHHYFGGVSLIAPNGAAGDPRRDGTARSLEN
jgi:gamma-glutamyltranspeptidase/glutathione hydrolase